MERDSNGGAHKKGAGQGIKYMFVTPVLSINVKMMWVTMSSVISTAGIHDLCSSHISKDYLTASFKLIEFWLNF